MLIDTVGSALDDFWKDQNQKLISIDGFLSDRGNLFSQKLFFKAANKRVIELDFSVFDLPHLEIKFSAILTINGNTYPLSIKEYAKLTVINNASTKNLKAVRVPYLMLRHLAGFLNARDSQSLTLNNIEQFHHSFLTETINEKGISNRLAPYAYQGSYNKFSFSRNRNTLQALGVTGLIDTGLTQRQFDRALNTVCQTVMGISLSEYKEGSSYNFLTLELGQYYVDYLRHVYETDYFYTLVCQRAIHSIYEQFSLDNVSEAQIWRDVIADTIQGVFSPNKKHSSASITRDKLHKALMATLFDEYQAHFEKVQSLREENIYEVVKALGIEIRFDSIEVIRILMLQKYYPFDAHKSAIAVWKAYLSSLDKTYVDSQRLSSVTLDDIYALMLQTIEPKKLDSADFITSVHQWSKKLNGRMAVEGFSGFTRELERVSDAMTCLVIAWLGYRKSEFGFPLSAIHSEQNLDILDNSHVPFRFKLRWVVPKTNGKTKLDREITSQCYQLASQLDELFQPKEGEPCLYTTRGKSKKQTTPNESEDYISYRVKSNWESFVTQYPPFEEINDLKRLSQLEVDSLSPNDKERLNSLSTKYDLSSARAQHLLESSEEVKLHLKRLLCTGFAHARSHAEFKSSLTEFNKTGDISNPEHKTIVNKYLSTETKEWLLADDIDLDRKAMTDISNELLQGVRYPSPHAFRHIWAEAVLTRYQGDIGAVIRHQFCHLDDSYFMAYLRNKEASDLLKVARMKVLNSIVDTLLIENDQIGRKHLGGFARFVGKAAALTKPVTQEEMRALKDHIMGRVISISSSPFADCIPREGGESRAKCAEFGDINPHNAKPEFCLDCTNARITEGNIRGIWEVIQPFVKEALNDDVMGFMVQHHLAPLRSAHNRIKQLQTEHNAHQTNKILSWIQKAIESIKLKLDSEAPLYA